MLISSVCDPHEQGSKLTFLLVYNRYDRYFKNRADYGLIGIWSVSADFLLLPISCTDFNNVGVSQKSAKIAQKMLVKNWN